jgi:hypothetical protein
MTEEFQPPDPSWEALCKAEAEAAMSGADEPLVWGMKRGSKTEDGQVVWESVGVGLGPRPTRPMYYHPDGTPIVDNDLMPATMQWAMLFEERDSNRQVGSTKTLYGERLSTVWLGLDHNFMGEGPPIIYETMLFAPDPENVRRTTITALCDAAMGRNADPEAIAKREAFNAYIEKNYPHDQLQLRYSTRQEAEDSHEKLKLQCLIPPRWRHFLLWTIGQDRTWKHWEDKEDEE